MPRPIPVPDELSKPFWDACNERRLVVQNCTACNRVQFPPEKACVDCGSDQNLGWKEVQGRGSITGHIVIHDSRLKSWWEEQPYNVAIIALEEHPELKFFSNLPGRPVDDVPVGANVQVIFEEVSPTQLLHEWQIVG